MKTNSLATVEYFSYKMFFNVIMVCSQNMTELNFELFMYSMTCLCVFILMFMQICLSGLFMHILYVVYSIRVIYMYTYLCCKCELFMLCGLFMPLALFMHSYLCIFYKLLIL